MLCGWDIRQWQNQIYPNDDSVFAAKITLITDRQKAGEIIDTFIEEMHERNAQMSDFGADIQALGVSLEC